MLSRLARLVLLAAVSAVACGAPEPQGPLVPVIRDDAFRNDTATTLLGPEAGPLNDHFIVEDDNGVWHLFAINEPKGSFGQLNNLAHGTASTFPALMERHPPVLDSLDLGTCAVLAPHIIPAGEEAFMFYTDTQMCDDINQHVFAMRLATSPLDDLFEWTDHGILFEDFGYSRDPFLFFDEGAQRWLMYYHRKLEYDVALGQSAISYKTSTDLLTWSEETFDAVTGVPDTQLIPGSAESPQVVLHDGFYYLFLTHPELLETYADTYVYRSRDPTHFGTFEDHITILFTHAPEILFIDGQHYITHAGDPQSALGPDDFRVPGVEAAPLDWH